MKRERSKRPAIKVLALPCRNGKLKGEQIREVVRNHWEDATHEHMVQPGMVYISNPTEIGTIYHQKGLEELTVPARTVACISTLTEPEWDMDSWQETMT